MNLAIDIMDGCGISNEMCSQLLGLGDSGIFSIRGNAGYTIHDYEYYHDTSREVSHHFYVRTIVVQAA